VSKRLGDPGYPAQWCIHYRGISDGRGGFNDSCEAGVKYERWKGIGFDKQPCFLHKKTGESLAGAATCEHLRRPTKEEIALHEQWLRQRMDRMGVLMTGISPWRDAHKGKSAQEVIECPVCKGRLHVSIAAYNGHMRGRCETTDCVAWME